MYDKIHYNFLKKTTVQKTVTFWGSWWTHLGATTRPTPLDVPLLSEASDKILWNRCWDDGEAHCTEARRATGLLAAITGRTSYRTGAHEGYAVVALGQLPQAGQPSAVRSALLQLQTKWAGTSPVLGQRLGQSRPCGVASVSGTTESGKALHDCSRGCAVLNPGERPSFLIFNSLPTFSYYPPKTPQI